MHYSVKQDAVVWQRVEDEVIYLDLATSEYQSVNAAGAVLWEALAAGTSREAMVTGLVQQFAISEELASADVDAFLADLQGRGLLDSR